MAELAALALLLALTLVVFGRSVGHGFVIYDDPDYVTENPAVQRGLTAEGFAWSFGFRASNWHPLTWLSHMLDVDLYGAWAGGHHLTNVLLHVLNVGLLFLALRRMTQAPWASLAAAAEGKKSTFSLLGRLAGQMGRQ